MAIRQDETTDSDFTYSIAPEHISSALLDLIRLLARSVSRADFEQRMQQKEKGGDEDA